MLGCKSLWICTLFKSNAWSCLTKSQNGFFSKWPAHATSPLRLYTGVIIQKSRQGFPSASETDQTIPPQQPSQITSSMTSWAIFRSYPSSHPALGFLSSSLLVPAKRISVSHNFPVSMWGSSTYKSKNSFQRIENKSPWSPLHRILVLSPRPNNPVIPSSRITNLAASAIHRSA